MTYSNYDIHLRASVRLLWFKWKWNGKICKYLCKYRRKYANYRSSWSQVTEWLFYRFRKILKKSTALESYFSTVTDLAILLKQKSTTGVFVKTFQNFQNRYFLCNTSRRLLQNFQTILILPALLVCRDKRGRRVNQFRILCWKSFWLTVHWGFRNTLMQSNTILTDVYQR